ncbi:MAG: serine hydrolase [Chloroflexota bacterium]|nr:serine hydrolase [Chloroflexota bacterium]
MDEAAFAQLDRYIERQMAADNTPGLGLALTDRERTLRVATYGFADLAARTPVTPDHLFEIGSIGESFTSLALLREHEAGNLNLQAPVARYLPWFEVRSAFPPITVHHLLSHTSGIIAGTDPTPGVEYQVWALRETEAATAPGTSFHYSNIGYKALGLVLERLTGQRYGDAIRSHVLTPLGMAASEPVITNALRPRLAVGYASLYDDRPAHLSHPLVPATWLETESGDGSIASTPEEMAVYLRMLLNSGRGTQDRLLSEAGFATKTQRIIAIEEGDDPACYGYGIYALTVDGHSCVGHDGGMVGYSAVILGDLDDGLGAVVLVNSASDPFAIALKVLALLRAARRGDALAAPLEPPDPTLTDDAAAYVGTYRGDAGTIRVVAEDDRLVLDHDGERVVLEPYGDDTFIVPHPIYDRFVLSFGRQADAGEVVELFHGAGWYVNDRYQGPTSFDTPPEWDAFPGHYRAHTPWATNFRVVQRKGQLWLVFPVAPYGFDDEQPLVPLGDGSFRAGADESCPERVRFDVVVDGKALRAALSDGFYERDFTP